MMILKNDHPPHFVHTRELQPESCQDIEDHDGAHATRTQSQPSTPSHDLIPSLVFATVLHLRISLRVSATAVVTSGAAESMTHH